MKNTGVIRKIDDLGRIVIPKEIRGVLNIRNGDSLAFFVEDKKIILEKYNQMDSMKDKSLKLVSSVSDLVDASIFITDKDKIVTPGLLEGKDIPKNLVDIMLMRKEYTSLKPEKISFGGEILEGFFIIKTLLKESDPIGLLILYKRSNLEKDDAIFTSLLKNIIENN